ncbi:ATP-grasp domain-containing protein [Saccharothrix xinjiangensis]|uniref:ATP-grasp domain-containing protein n=1 Tax=Saccharothrix xinjiangensis TaxID=204798 RepID=A0ABV9YBY8_9PSEU
MVVDELGGCAVRIMMVGCGWMGRPYLSRAHRRGIHVAVLDSEAALSWDETRAAFGPGDKGYAVPFPGEEGWLAAAAAALRDGPVDGIVAFSEAHVRPAALLADELGLPGPGMRAALTSRNKLAQRELFARRGIAQPDFHAAVRASGSAGVWSANRYPVVAKPLSKMGSEGVRICADATELHDWLVALDSDDPFLVEQHLTGVELSVEAVVDRGDVLFWNITAKTISAPPFCVELEHQAPADIDEDERSAIRQCLDEVLGALDMGSGIAHLEVILRNRVPHVVEIAVRTPGDYLMEVIEAATGVDLFDAVIAVACGLPCAVDPVASDVAAVWFPTAPPGVVVTLNGHESLHDLDGVVRAEIDVTPGSVVTPLRSSMDRLGMVVYKAQERAELLVRRERIRRTLVLATQS